MTLLPFLSLAVSGLYTLKSMVWVFIFGFFIYSPLSGDLVARAGQLFHVGYSNDPKQAIVA
jgi:hypothetical protein